MNKLYSIEEVEKAITEGEKLGMLKQIFWIQLRDTMRENERLRHFLSYALPANRYASWHKEASKLCEHPYKPTDVENG
jgi:hypothetical protein